MNEDGFASVLMVSLLALAALVCLAAADAANVIVTRARVQSAADASALAAATAQWRGGSEDPAEAAADVAQRNGVELESCECPRHGDTAVVVVATPTRVRMLGVAPRRASARAEARLDVAMMFRPPN